MWRHEATVWAVILPQRTQSLSTLRVFVLPSFNGSRVIATLSLPLPRLTRWGVAVWTFSPFPVSIRSRGGDYKHQPEGNGHCCTVRGICSVHVSACVCNLSPWVQQETFDPTLAGTLSQSPAVKIKRETVYVSRPRWRWWRTHSCRDTNT